MTDQNSLLEKTFLQWDLGKTLRLTSKAQVQERLRLQLLQARTCTTSLRIDRLLLEVYQELLSEQELR